MRYLLPMAALLTAAPVLADEPSATPCGLEEVSNAELATCPPHVTYDEEGEEVGG